jgi:hypothetical protein
MRRRSELVNNVGYTTLVNGRFTGGDASNPAIRLEKGADGYFFRNIEQDGYGKILVKADGSEVEGNRIDEMFTGNSHAPFGNKVKSLALEVPETPEVPWEDELDKWVVVKNPEGKNDTEAVQAAFDKAAETGATTVCFPWGRGPRGHVPSFFVQDTIRIKGKVSRVIGMENSLHFLGEVMEKGTGPLFSIETDPSVKAIVFEHFFGLRTGPKRPARTFYAFDPKSDVDVVVKHLVLGGKMSKPTADGSKKRRWFFEDVTGMGLHLGPGDEAYLRQWNPEHWKLPFSDINGGKAWILGLKSEGRAAHITARNGAKVEVVGGMVYQSWAKQPTDPPMIESINSDVSVNVAMFFMKDPFSVLIREVNNGVEKTVRTTADNKWTIGLYRSKPQNSD